MEGKNVQAAAETERPCLSVTSDQRCSSGWPQGNTRLSSSSHPRPQVWSKRSRRSFTSAPIGCVCVGFSFPLASQQTSQLLHSRSSSKHRAKMECTITSYSPGPPTVSRMKYMKADTTKTVLHVNFEPEKGEVQERKKKYLTAKYGQHQMNLIRKRLRVEMWMFDQLQALYGHRDEDSTSYDIEIDLDELLDIEGDFNRKAWLGGKVIGAKKSQENVEKFICELLQRAKTL